VPPKLEWRAPARADLQAILDYIANDNPDAALALLDEIDSKLARLPQNPKLYKTGRVKGTRELVVRPNYIVVYAEDARTITVLRVLHAARRRP